MSPDKAWELIVAGAVVVDVRSQKEVAAGTLPGAIVIPHDQLPQCIDQLPPDKSASLVFYCGVGARAEIARRIAVASGYEKAYNAGGFKELFAFGRARGLC